MPKIDRIEIKKGAIDTIPIGISTAVFGLSVGALAHKTGLSFFELAIMSITVFAGASQAVAIELWTEPVPILPIILATFFVNIRHIPMGAALVDTFRGLNRRRLYSSLFIMSDSSWAVTLSKEKQARSFSYYLGSGVAAYLLWVISTLFGHYLGGYIKDPSQFGLDFAMVAIFIYLFVSTCRKKSNFSPWILAALFAAVSYQFFPGTIYIVIGSAAGSIVGIFMGEELNES